MRRIFGVIAGVIAANLIVYAIEWLDTVIYPIPAIDAADPAAFAGIIAGMPFIAKLIVVIGWFAGGCGGAWLALRITDWRPAAWIVGGCELAASSFNIVSLPHPVWMEVCAVAMPILAVSAALRLHGTPYPGEPLLG